MAKANEAMMKKAGFESARGRVSKPRLIMAISGLEKQGKTHFALTAPGPIAMFSVDIGEEGVVQKFDDKEVWVMDVAGVGDEDSPDDSEKEWARFKKSFDQMLRTASVRTIILDTATEIWELLRMAKFGKLTQVMPYQYGPVNKIYRMMVRSAYEFDKNLILIHKLKSKYVNDKRTGEYEPAGFNDTPFLVQVNATVYRYSPEDGGEFAIQIKDCRQNPDMAGFEADGPLCNFPMIAQMILPSVNAGEWE